VKLKLDDTNPMQYKKDIDNLGRIWKRSVKALQGLEKVLCRVELKK